MIMAATIGVSFREKKTRD
uniref:Uncharacterized protein n=1 Tax=Arundo donax TaxID=35708 RepID=A0A0A9AAN3_ARUDO